MTTTLFDFDAAPAPRAYTPPPGSATVWDETLEDRHRCPKCGHAGIRSSLFDVPGKGVLLVHECMAVDDAGVPSCDWWMMP